MALPNAILMYGDRASQPAAAPENNGCYYRVTDEGDIVEQSDGSTWVPIAASASGGSLSEVTLLTADPGAPVDDTFWVKRTGAGPYDIILCVRIGGATIEFNIGSTV